MVSHNAELVICLPLTCLSFEHSILRLNNYLSCVAQKLFVLDSFQVLTNTIDIIPNTHSQLQVTWFFPGL